MTLGLGGSGNQRNHWIAAHHRVFGRKGNAEYVLYN